jgi:osmotically-inducible protein OsmY
MKTNLFVFSVFILIMANLSCAIMPQKDKITDQMMKTFVEYRLIESKLLVNDNITVTVENGVITLNGTVSNLRNKQKAEKEIHKVAENYRIVNNLGIPKSNLSDADFTKMVTERIRQSVFYSIFDWVTVSTMNGVVTLNGWTHLPWGDVQYAEEAEKIVGVLEVKNEIQHELGAWNLAGMAARLIYNDMRFDAYAHYPDPPIHIIAIGPKVILLGTVQSESDKSWAERLLRLNTEITEIVEVENDLVVENQ